MCLFYIFEIHATQTSMGKTINRYLLNHVCIMTSYDSRCNRDRSPPGIIAGTFAIKCNVD